MGDGAWLGRLAFNAALIREGRDTDQGGVAETALTDERELALQRFYALLPKEQLIVYRAAERLEPGCERSNESRVRFQCR